MFTKSWQRREVVLLSMGVAAAIVHRRATAQTTNRIEKAQPTQGNEMSPQDRIQAKGKELRSAIEAIYAQMPVSNVGGIRLAPLSLGRDISDTIERYIPSGISFDEAESILQRAGFTITRPRRTEPVPEFKKFQESYDVLADVDVRTGNPPVQMRVRVGLRTPGDMNYEVVAGVWGRLLKQAP
jgi:hypothetical protein